MLLLDTKVGTTPAEAGRAVQAVLTQLDTAAPDALSAVDATAVAHFTSPPSDASTTADDDAAGGVAGDLCQG